MNFEGVEFKESVKDGAVMVATKQFKRGDVIFKEKPLLISKDLSYGEIEELSVIDVPERFPGMLKAFCALSETGKQRVLALCKSTVIDIPDSLYFDKLRLVAQKCNRYFKWAQPIEESVLVNVSYLTSRCLTTSIGLCLYEHAIRVRHSCEPTCTRVFGKASTVSVLSLCDINLGEEITFSFVDGLMPKFIRTYELTNRFGVICDRPCCSQSPQSYSIICDKCSFPLSLAQMLYCKKNLGYKQMDVNGCWKCGKCGSTSYPVQLHQQTVLNLTALNASADNDFIDIQESLILFARMLGLKHPSTLMFAKKFLNEQLDLMLKERIYIPSSAAPEVFQNIVSLADIILDYCKANYDLIGGDILVKLAGVLTQNGFYDEALRYKELFESHMVCLFPKTGPLADIINLIMNSGRDKKILGPQIVDTHQ